MAVLQEGRRCASQIRGVFEHDGALRVRPGWACRGVVIAPQGAGCREEGQSPSANIAGDGRMTSVEHAPAASSSSRSVRPVTVSAFSEGGRIFEQDATKPPA